MAYNNFGYTGYVPSNVSVQDNINQALQYQATHSPIDTLFWFKSMVQNNGDWDYKQQSADYENFGNFNYGAIGAALGYPDFVLQSAAGGAQLTSLNGDPFELWVAYDFLNGLKPNTPFGSFDDSKDQEWINKGIEALKKSLNSLTPEEKKKLEESGFLFPKPKTVEVSVVSMGARYEDQGSITFAVTLSAPLTQAITIDLLTLDGSAQMGSDYSANSKFTVTIPAGSRVGYYSVPLKDDDRGEDTETFTVAPYTAWYTGKERIFLKSAGYGVILDNDGKGDGDNYYEHIPVNVTNQNFSSPLVLDLNGDGVTSTFIYDTQTYFDLNNDGIRERTAWTQTDDGILVFDKNQNGIIDNGNELFGNNTTLKNGTKAANGFEALKEYDDNKDYVIDKNDNIYHALKIWQDSNRDGISQANELKTLEEMNIQAIGVIYADTESYEGQNVARQRSFFIGENADGIINDGSELFGKKVNCEARETTLGCYTTLANGTKASNGFEALAKYDNNHDGVIDKNDSAYNALSAWIDSDQDGILNSYYKSQRKAA